MNIELANVLYNMYQSVWKILEEYSEKTVDIIKHGAEVKGKKWDEAPSSHYCHFLY